MKIRIAAVGRLRRGPEADLVADYLDRFAKQGRNLGLGPAEVAEVEDKRGLGMAAEAGLLRKAIPKSATTLILDERGTSMTSPDFARFLARLRDQGTPELAIVIGGADGIDPTLRSEADHALSFGAMVWPHMLVRVMVAEQLYRAAGILAGTPYHRE